MSDLFESIQRLLLDPTGNAAALAAAVSIIVLLVLVAVLVLLALALPDRDMAARPSETDEQAASRLAARRRARLTVLAVVAVASFAAIVVWYQSTSSTRYCTRVCHQMAEPAATWRASSHASVSCTRCHEGRPWVSFPEGVAGRARSLYLYAVGGKGGSSTVPAERCIDCHTGLLDEELTALNGETYVHRDDYDAGRTCRSCHGKQGHERPTRR